MAEVQPLNSLFVTACELYGSHGGEKDDAYDILRSIIGERKNMNVGTFKKSILLLRSRSRAVKKATLGLINNLASLIL